MLMDEDLIILHVNDARIANYSILHKTNCLTCNRH